MNFMFPASSWVRPVGSRAQELVRAGPTLTPKLVSYVFWGRVLMISLDWILGCIAQSCKVVCFAPQKPLCNPSLFPCACSSRVCTFETSNTRTALFHLQDENIPFPPPLPCAFRHCCHSWVLTSLCSCRLSLAPGAVCCVWGSSGWNVDSGSALTIAVPFLSQLTRRPPVQLVLL